MSSQTRLGTIALVALAAVAITVEAIRRRRLTQLGTDPKVVDSVDPEVVLPEDKHHLIDRVSSDAE